MSITLTLNIFLDIDECSLKEHDCHLNATCHNIPGSYECSCNKRFEGDGKMCDLILIDECSKEIHDCHENATCTDTMLAFTCACEEGKIWSIKPNIWTLLFQLKNAVSAIYIFNI